MVKEQKDGRSLGSDSAPGNVTDTTPKKGGTEKAKAATKAKGRAKKAAAAKKSDEFVGGDSDGENGFSNDVTSDKKTVKGVKKGGVFNKRKSVAVKDEYVKHFPAQDFLGSEISDFATTVRTMTRTRRSRRRKRALATITTSWSLILPPISSLLNSTPLPINKSRCFGQRRLVSLESVLVL